MAKGPLHPLPPLLLGLVLCGAAAPRAASAAEDRPAAPAAAPTEGDDLDALVLRARAALDARDFALAATLLEGAQARRPAPELLFYLGEAYRELPGGTARALRAYRRYLSEERQPDPSLQARATAAIAELSGKQAQERSQGAGPAGRPRAAVRGVPAAPALTDGPAATAPPGQVLSMTPAVPPQPAAPSRGGRRIHTGGIALLGAAVVLGAVGGLLLSQSVARADASRDADSFAEHVADLSSARQLLGAGSASLAVAGAAALCGGGLLVVHALGRRLEERLTLRPGPGGLGLSLEGQL